MDTQNSSQDSDYIVLYVYSTDYTPLYETLSTDAGVFPYLIQDKPIDNSLQT